jgi:tetratricopeptide (TPR) repeat protein
MKSFPAWFFILGVLLSTRGLAQQQSVSPEAVQHSSSGEPVLGDETPAQQRIVAAKQQIATDPKRVQAYNELALAYIRRTRETADPKYLKDADTALTQGLKLEPENFSLQKAQVVLMLSRDQFSQARERATNLNHRTPDDVMIYGYIADADIALGNYPEAETDAQWMMNLRPNNTPALLVGAKLRTLYGDAHGAIDFLNRAYAQTSPTEVEDLAWIANQIASIQIESGQADLAAHTLEAVEQILPRYPYTIENLARVRMAQNRVSDAIELWTRAARIDKDPHILYQLARAQEAAGQAQDANATYAQFGNLARAPETATETATLDLILMYAGNTASAPNALKLAQQEIAARQDVWTLDAYGWALFANARYQDADIALQKAIAVGIQSAQIFDHAGHIAQKLGHAAEASKYFGLALQANPSSEYALDAQKSVGSTHVTGIGEHPVSPVPAQVPMSTADLPRDSTPETNTFERTTAHDSASSDTPSTVFAPVPESLLTPRPTGTERMIHSAQTLVARDPKDATAYAGLGAAYFQRARETADVSDYELAEQALTKSLDLASDDFSSEAALETLAEVCMGEHRFTDALTYAQRALSLGTGELTPFAIVGDADADMGEYDKAAAAYGRLTPRDMTPSPRAAYARDSRVSYLKFISGDTAGAIVLMKTAVAEGVQAQLPAENLAWLCYELGEYDTQAGDAPSADTAYLAALNIHPGDYRALAALGKLRANEGRSAEAIVLYQKAIAIVPMPIFVAELGDLYAKAGNQTEARKQYALVGYIGLLGRINQVLHNRDLAVFYADHDMKLSEALDLAQKELEVRRDIYTWDALAWALYKNGKLTEAAEASGKALHFGTRDSLLLFHAGMIAEGLGQHEQARGELKQALEINPHFHPTYAEAAQQRLAALEKQSKSEEGSDQHGR